MATKTKKKAQLKPEQQETWDALKDEVITPALEKGWTTMERKGINGMYAYVDLHHPEEEYKLAVFLAVDAEKHEDKYIFGSQIITGPQARELLLAPGFPNPDHLDYEEDPEDSSAAHVPPTDAAHQEVVPPTDNSVAPIATDDAAHSDSPMPPTDVDDAAHTEVNAFHDESKYGNAARLQKHLAAAGNTSSQQDTTGIVKTMSSDPDRMWGAYSELTDAELLKATDGKQVTWNNAFAKRRESAVVTHAKRAGKHPARITGFVSDAGSDTRIMHFLEAGGSFRSLAIAKLTEIS